MEEKTKNIDDHKTRRFPNRNKNLQTEMKQPYDATAAFIFFLNFKTL